ncbi:MAG: UDP-N-acetylmuramoyl-L-alanyl-D-glutamate--2,6-diaminopimelate ligase [Parcubacteria bacterium C7867-004]|nr:MAG: UDP-N-acetylmuramoyl-L-alanyl-D-glutamate--2,6-diaminopimelate ligase [Parcubacteria bacterium C7867-004]
MGTLKRLIESLLPRRVYRALLAPYHLAWTALIALKYGFPANKLTVIGVTGTKGKSSVSEMLVAILEEAGHSVALSSTIHFKVGDETRPNLYKMTLPGRGFIQKLLGEAVEKGCTHAVIEITSEAALQYRHLLLSMDALVFTNLEREHIESHGGMEQYVAAKLRIGKAMERSPKRPRAIIANTDNRYADRFLALSVEEKISFSLADAQDIERAYDHVAFTYDDVRFSLPHPGDFSIRNALASVKASRFLGVPIEKASAALAKLAVIPGRAERIEAGQDFVAVVDYAHTPDSLKALYEAYQNKRKICVLGNTGGGRDTWKRPEMGRIAEEYCDEVILTNEDPYDEDPDAIVRMMAKGMKQKTPTIIMDRREAIAHALSSARTGDVVLVTGKGTDPYLMEANGVKTPWSDAGVVREELEKIVR